MFLTSTMTTNINTIVILLYLFLDITTNVLTKRHRINEGALAVWLTITDVVILMYVAGTLYGVINWPHNAIFVFNFVLAVAIAIVDFKNHKSLLKYY